MWKRSGNPKVVELNKSIKDRSYNLSFLQPMKLEELNSKGKPKRLCAWCNGQELLHGNQKYCTQHCSNSAMAWAYPQKEGGLRFLLIRQEWKCAICKYDYKAWMDKVLERDIKVYGKQMLDYDNLPWYYFSRLKTKVPSDRKPEVDHILAIYKGGQSLGLDNHQVLCYSCHKVKTKVDLSGKRNKL
jgi:5-methylcytosine-specific restriction endonuclease McrA